MAQEIKFDTKNYRKHNDKNLDLISKSLKECGAGRSILIDNQGEIIAGNATYQNAEKLGIPVKIIKTDGSELIAVQRTDLATNDEKRKKLALLDNSTSDKVEWDIDNLSADFDLRNLEEFGVEGLQGFEETQAEVVEDEVPEEVETKCKKGGTMQIKEKQYYAKWYQANKEKKKAQVKAYRERFKDFIREKQHQAYLKRKAEGYYA